MGSVLAACSPSAFSTGTCWKMDGSVSGTPSSASGALFFFVLLNILWAKPKFSACKMQVTVILSLESYQEQKCISQRWTPEALEGAEPCLLL